jgi:uncharacterized protein (DUF924 family)
MTPDAVIHFWYEEKGSSAWYASDPDLDTEIRERFGATFEAASVGELFEWRDTASGRLAEIVVLDQFSRNMFRNSARAFAADPVALVLAQQAVSLGVHEALGDRKDGVLMPYMHSESRRVHEEAVRLFAGTKSLPYEISHKAIIDRFGRYPHRNEVLGRVSTPEEEAFPREPNSNF